MSSAPHQSSSPSPITSPTPQTYVSDFKRKQVGAVAETPIVNHQNAHPTAYYLFDLLFKLIASGALVAIVAFLAIGVRNAKSQSDDVASELSSIGSNLYSLNLKINTLNSYLGDIKNSVERSP